MSETKAVNFIKQSDIESVVFNIYVKHDDEDNTCSGRKMILNFLGRY